MLKCLRPAYKYSCCGSHAH